MKGAFRTLFCIYPGEEKNAIIFSVLAFLWSLAIAIGQEFADALFLVHVGASSLPLAFALTASSMMICAILLLKKFHNIQNETIFTSILFSGATFYAFIYLYFLSNTGADSIILWYLLKIVASLLFTLAITCFWTFLDQFYHHQDVKRLYCLFNSSVFMGVATTGIVMRSNIVEFKNLTLFISVLLLLSAYLITQIKKKIKPVYDESTQEECGEVNNYSFRFLIKTVLKSNFTMLLILVNFLTYLFLVVTEFNYMSAFERSFISQSATVNNEQALTHFLGEAITTVSLINVFFGLFIYGRILRRFGITNTILCTPIVLSFTFLGWMFSDSFVFPVMGFFVVEGMLNFLDDNNFTLLLNAVPSKVKYRVRLIIESFFEPIGMFVSSILLTVSPLEHKTLGLILSSCALIVVLLLRKQYVKAIYTSLSENAIRFQKTLNDWFSDHSPQQNKEIEKRLFAYYEKGDASIKSIALEGLIGLQNPDLLPRILKITNELDSELKVEFLDILKKSHLVSHPQFLALTTKDLNKSLEELLLELQNPNLKIAREAAYQISKQITPLDAQYAHLLIQKLIISDTHIRQSCLHSLARLNLASTISQILVSSIHFRPEERRLTEKLVSKMSSLQVTTLLEIVKDITMHERCRVLAGRILGRVSLQDLHEHLFEIVKKEIDRAYFYFYYSHVIQERHLDKDLHYLVDVLKSNFLSVIDFIIQLLGVAGESEDCELLSHSFRSPNTKIRGYVLETLEKTCETPIFRALYPLIAEIPLETKLQYYIKAGNPNLSLSELLNSMSASLIKSDQLIAIALKYRLNMPHWKESLRKQIASQNVPLHHFAYELLEA